MNQIALREPGTRSVLFDMSDRYGMEPIAFEATLRATVVPKDCSREQFAAFLLVAKEYKLNPILKEIYAFPAKGGGIQPIVGVDGWANLINSHPAFDGMDFEDHFNEGGDLVSITCRMHRKDRSHAITATEYLAECKRSTEPWTKWPRRMLRHKSMIQAARYAFSFAGIIDPDEAERFAGEFAQDVTPRAAIVPISQRIADAQTEAQREAGNKPSPPASTADEALASAQESPAGDSGTTDTPHGEPQSSQLNPLSLEPAQSPQSDVQAEKPATGNPPAANAVAGTLSESSDSPADEEVQAGASASGAGLPSTLPVGWAILYAAQLRDVTDKKGLTPAARKFWAQHGSWNDHKDTPDGTVATAIFDAFRDHFGNREQIELLLRELI